MSIEHIVVVGVENSCIWEMRIYILMGYLCLTNAGQAFLMPRLELP